jgi:hypothetical protein
MVEAHLQEGRVETSKVTDMVENAQSVPEAAETARQLFQDKDNSRFWPGPLVRRLESAGPRLALRWAIRLFQESLPARRRAGLESQQQRWLADLSSLIDRDDVANHCNEVAHGIWNNDPDMNFLERGIARLYWALQNHQAGLLEPDYYLQVASAVGLLADNGGSPGDMDKATFERAIALFHRLLAETNGNVG